MENLCSLAYTITYAKSLHLLSKTDRRKNLKKSSSMDLLFNFYQWAFSLNSLKQNSETIRKRTEQAL